MRTTAKIAIPAVAVLGLAGASLTVSAGAAVAAAPGCSVFCHTIAPRGGPVHCTSSVFCHTVASLPARLSAARVAYVQGQWVTAA
jgi:hypothetical protein